jgi:DNA-binding NarL/FixJ family response regulator
MRYLLCDDDAPLRAVLRTIVLDRGHEVVGEAETAAEARGLLALDPDVVIVDLALRSGSGLDVGRAAVEQGCRVLVFSAFIGTAGTDFADAAISKPDFFALEAAMDALTTRQADGARWEPATTPFRTDRGP